MEKRFVSIWFPHIKTDWFQLRYPELKGKPFVLTSAVHGKMMITSASPQATNLGVTKGMALADARAIWPSLKAIDDLPAISEKLFLKIAAWCIRFSPVSGVDPLGGIFLDATGCAHLWGSEQEYLSDILKRLSEKGFQARASMASTPGCAWALARYGTQLIAYPNNQSELLLPLPPAALRIDPGTLECLQKLGLHQLKDFIYLPRTALRRRFGSLLLQRIDEALGSTSEYILPVNPPQPFHERLPCLEAITRREGIEMALTRLLETLCKNLQNEGKGLRAAKLRCLLTDGTEQSASIATTAASCNPQHLFHLFSLEIGKIQPGNGIELFILEADRIEKHLALQVEYWKNASGFNNPRLTELIDRITLRLGEHSVNRYLPAEHYWPERAFTKTRSLAEESKSVWKTDKPRPLILLPEPEKIEVTAPIPDYPPMFFRRKNKLHKIVSADGPERIEQEWWIEEGRHRDYYAVEDEEGGRYWLFRLGHYDAARTYRWFLHGYFT